MKRVALLSAALLLSVTASFGSGVLVEAESFRDKGGWAVDQQFMDQMGSPYLIAHGMGKPVADAVTTVEFPETGTYRVYVRTFNWVAPWYDGEGPGKFALRVGSRKLSATLGCTGSEWMWQCAGKVSVRKGPVSVSLTDLSRIRRPLRRRLFHHRRGRRPSVRKRGTRSVPQTDARHPRNAANRRIVRFRRRGRRHRRHVRRGRGVPAGVQRRSGQRPPGAGRQQQLRNPRAPGRRHRAWPQRGTGPHDPRIRPLARRQRPAGRKLRGREEKCVHRRGAEREAVLQLPRRSGEQRGRPDKIRNRPPHRNRGGDDARSAAFRRLHGRRNRRIPGRSRLPHGPREPATNSAKRWRPKPPTG